MPKPENQSFSGVSSTVKASMSKTQEELCFILSLKAGKGQSPSSEAAEQEECPPCERASLCGLVRPSADEMRPIYSRKSDLLYSVY